MDGTVLSPELQQSLLLAGSTLITALVLEGIKRFIAFIPNKWLPVIAPVIGAIATSLTEVSTMQGVNIIIGMGAGAAAVGLHQVPKQLAKPE